MTKSLPTGRDSSREQWKVEWNRAYAARSPGGSSSNDSSVRQSTNNVANCWFPSTGAASAAVPRCWSYRASSSVSSAMNLS